MKRIASLAAVLLLATITTAAQRTTTQRGTIDPPSDPIYSAPQCETFISPGGTIGQYETRACLGQQYCNLWSREYCPNAWVNYRYDHGGMCTFVCDIGPVGDSYRICNGPVCQ